LLIDNGLQGFLSEARETEEQKCNDELVHKRNLLLAHVNGHN
jgi:hypothetical protein